LSVNVRTNELNRYCGDPDGALAEVGIQVKLEPEEMQRAESDVLSIPGHFAYSRERLHA